MVKNVRIPFRADRSFVVILEDLRRISGIQNRSELIRLCVTGIHVLLRSGAYQYLKPLPRIAEIVLSQKNKKEGE